MDAFTSSGNYLGTERIGRSLADKEKKQLAKLLRAHDFVGASLIALRFAYKLTRSRERARDLAGRTNLRLVRWGWDPNAVTLVKRLCRLVWSEFHHMRREMDVARRAEEVFLREQRADGALLLEASPARGDPLRPPKQEPLVASPEQQLIRAADERRQEERNDRSLAHMRTALPMLRERFEVQKDEVNLIWLDCRLRGIEDPQTMARDSGRDVHDFYIARKRRQRTVRKLLSDLTGEPCVDEENE